MEKLNKNTLYLEKMGCNFFVDDDITKISDLNNYRYYTHNIELKSGEKLDTLEIGHGARYQLDNKNGYKYIDNFGCWFQTYYKDKDGCEWGLLELDKQLNKGNYNNGNLYTKETILNLINSISKNQYTNIEYIERF